MKPNTVKRESRQTLHTHPISPPKSEAGFASGTTILSLDGDIPVEFLTPGDRIISRDAGIVTLDHVARTTRQIRAVRFAAGSLGHTRPDHDLILPENQMVLIRDWRAKSLFGVTQAMVRAGDLIDGEYICDLGLQTMLLHQLHFATSHVIYAGGLEVAGQGSASEIELRAAA